jgi:transposase
MVYVGVGVGKRRCVTCVKQIAEKYEGDCKAVVESTGNMCIKTYEAFESNGLNVKLANPVKTRVIAEARVKTDKLDSKILAHLLRADLIAECYLPTREVRLSRAIFRGSLSFSLPSVRFS